MIKFSVNRQLLKLLSIVCACVLWYYVLGTEPITVNLDISLRIIAPVGKAVGNVVVKKVSVKLKGSRAFIRNLISGDEQIVMNLQKNRTKYGPEFDIYIGPEDIPVPFGIDIVDISPKKVHIVLEREITKSIPVKINFSGDISSEYKLISHSISPSNVMISGPIETMRKTARLHTVSVPLAHLEDSGEHEVDLAPFDPRIQLEKAVSFKLKYTVKPRKANLTLKKVKIKFLSSTRAFSSKTTYGSLEVLAPEGISKQSKKKMYIIADVPEGKKGYQFVKLRADLPDGVHLLRIVPDKIRIRIR
jgi:YbbR domain-containing protein